MLCCTTCSAALLLTVATMIHLLLILLYRMYLLRVGSVANTNIFQWSYIYMSRRVSRQSTTRYVVPSTHERETIVMCSRAKLGSLLAIQGSVGCCQ